jgi:hypothetical protein
LRIQEQVKLPADHMGSKNIQEHVQERRQTTSGSHGIQEHIQEQGQTTSHSHGSQEHPRTRPRHIQEQLQRLVFPMESKNKFKNTSNNEVKRPVVPIESKNTYISL